MCCDDRRRPPPHERHTNQPGASPCRHDDPHLRRLRHPVPRRARTARGVPDLRGPAPVRPAPGPAWTTPAALAAGHANAMRAEGELTGIGTEPGFAIGQRALLVPFGGSNLLWDCISLLDDATAGEVERRGGLAAIAISHPHYYSSMVDWAHRFDCPIHLHAADATHVMRPDPAIRHWDGETLALGDGSDADPRRRALRRAARSCTAPPGAGALLTGDIIQVIPDRTHVASCGATPTSSRCRTPRCSGWRRRRAVRLRALYGAWWGTVIAAGRRATSSGDRPPAITGRRRGAPGS